MLIKNLLKNGRGPVATVGVEAKMAEAAALLANQHIDVVVVCDDDRKVIGLISDSGIMRRVATCGGCEHSCEAGVSDIMERQVVTCHPGDDIRLALRLMRNQGFRRIPVVDRKGVFIGLACMREILLHQYKQAKFEEDELEHYYYGVGYH